MPVSPPSLCLVSGCGELVEAGRCPKHTKERNKEKQAKYKGRDTKAYDAKWAKASKEYLLESPYCVSPKHAGQGVPATVVDHIDGKGPSGERGYDKTNFQALCKSCHSTKTNLFDGGFGRKPINNMPWSPKQQCQSPTCHNLVDKGWCEECQKKNLAELNITVVAGPPLSGKTTYVDTHRGDKDLVIDLDAIAVALGSRTTHLHSKVYLPFMLTIRDAILDRLLEPNDVPHVWFIATAPKNKQRRQWWQAKVIVLETSYEECMNRAHTRGNTDYWERLVSEWWDNYETNAADTIIKTGVSA